MRIPILATCVALFVLTAGCGSAAPHSVADQPGTGTRTGPTTPAGPTSTPAPTTSSPPAVPGCRTSDVSLTLGTADGAAGSTYQELVMTNTSSHPCRSGGYGGVSYVGATGGHQVGSAADRDATKKPVAFVLLPDAHATATLQESTAENYPAATCQVTRVAGLRIYPPNQTASVFVKAGGTGCANAGVHLLKLSPYAPAK